MESQEQSE